MTTTPTLIRPSFSSARTRADARTPSARFTAPARFDVHQVEYFETWAAARRGLIEIDFSETTFLDLAALAAIERAAGRFGKEFAIISASPAVILTLEIVDQIRAGAALELAA